MASKADESGPMSDLAQEVSRRVGEVLTGSTIMSLLIYSMR
jgi:hypothetical protein